MYDIIKDIFSAVLDLLKFFKKRKTLIETIEIGNKVDNVLDILLEETNADRAYVFQFHNGDYFYSGLSIDKMTNTHEKVSQGISYEQLKYRDVATAPFRFLIGKIISVPTYCFPNTEEIPHYNTKLMMLDRGVKSCMFASMNDNVKRPVGFIGLDYVKSSVKDTEDVVNTDKAKLLAASEAIYELLVFGKQKSR